MTVSEDTKLDFYLKHRQQIEEWAALRVPAQRALDDALLVALSARGPELGPLLDVSVRGARIAKLRIPGAESEPTWIELQWSTSSLLSGTGQMTWPVLILAASPDAAYRGTRDQIKQRTRAESSAHGMTEEGRTGWWVWSGMLAPVAEPIVIEDYAGECLKRFEAAWGALHPLVLAAVRTVGR